ncbi:MAG: hypothetical protein methR_P3385 [Methyloprofundus sp.]|nr:MAG: hypothetical protein methR_P3385 [Methyloprofundus sp.]
MTEDSTNPRLDHNDAAVLQHMSQYQNIINRMANNSSACKNWSIVLVSAFLAFVIDKGKGDVAWLGAVPIMIFWFLDAYYLGLENKFRAAANASAEKIHTSTFFLADLFVVQADGSIPAQMRKGLFSWGTWPVYLGLLGLLCLVYQFS